MQCLHSVSIEKNDIIYIEMIILILICMLSYYFYEYESLDEDVLQCCYSRTWTIFSVAAVPFIKASNGRQRVKVFLFLLGILSIIFYLYKYDNVCE